MRLCHVVLAGIMAATLVAACGSPAEPTEPVPGIVFVSERDGNKEIYRMQPDGSDLARLTSDPGMDGEPAWSPDGRQIAFISHRDGTNDVFVMGADGSNPRNLIDDLEDTRFDEFTPTWSPDGQTLAFNTDRFELGGCSFHRMATMPVIGGKGGIAPVKTQKGNHRSIAWSPDGRYLAHSSHCDSNDVIRLFLWDRETGKRRRLTEHASRNLYPAWSHDGRFLAFVSTRDGNSEIYVLELATGSVKNLTQHPAKDLYPTWSPDDLEIAFTTDRDGNSEVYVMGADGSKPRNLTQHAAYDAWPSWSPVR